MLNQLFKYPRVLNRYLTSPLLDMRLAYLRHCAEQGFSQISLQLIAYYQLVITDYLNLQTAHTITPSEIARRSRVRNNGLTCEQRFSG
jgi:hypothetical protein